MNRSALVRLPKFPATGPDKTQPVTRQILRNGFDPLRILTILIRGGEPLIGSNHGFLEGRFGGVWPEIHIPTLLNPWRLNAGNPSLRIINPEMPMWDSGIRKASKEGAKTAPEARPIGQKRGQRQKPCR